MLMHKSMCKKSCPDARNKTWSSGRTCHVCTLGKSNATISIHQNSTSPIVQLTWLDTRVLAFPRTTDQSVIFEVHNIMTIFSMQMDMEHQPYAHLQRGTHCTVMETSTKAKKCSIEWIIANRGFLQSAPLHVLISWKVHSSDRLLKMISTQLTNLRK
jgi:hypothetical protein